jgi:hypothetical protein
MLDKNDCNIKTKTKIQVTHRGPSKYNIFISNALKEIGKKYPDIPSTDRMKIAQQMYHKNIN